MGERRYAVAVWDPTDLSGTLDFMADMSQLPDEDLARIQAGKPPNEEPPIFITNDEEHAANYGRKMMNQHPEDLEWAVFLIDEVA